MTSFHVLRWCLSWGHEKETVDYDVTDVEDSRGCGNSGVQLYWLGVQHLISVFFPARSNMVNCVAHENLYCTTFPYRCTPASFISCIIALNSTITRQYIVKLSLSLSPYENYELTLVLAMGPGYPPAVKVWTANTARFGSVPDPSKNPTQGLLVGQTRTRTHRPTGFGGFA